MKIKILNIVPEGRICPKGYNLGGDKGFVFDSTNVPCNVNLIAVKRKNQIVQF